MKSVATLNHIIAVVVVITFMVFVAWWLSFPVSSPFALQMKLDLQGSVRGIAFSPKGDLLAVLVHTDPPIDRLTVTLRRIPEGKTACPDIIVSHKPRIFYWRSLAFSPDERFCAVGYEERGSSKVAVFSVADGKRMQTIEMGKGKLSSVTFAPDGQKLAFVYDDRIWFVNIANGRKEKTNIVSEFFVFSPDGRFIASSGPSLGAVSIYDTNGRLVQQISVNRPNSIFSLYSATFSQDGRKLLCVWGEGWTLLGRVTKFRKRVCVWRTKDWKLECSLPLTPFYHPDVVPVTGLPVDISPEGAVVALAEPRLSDLKWMLWQGEQFLGRLFKFLKVTGPPILPNQVSIRQTTNGQLIARLTRLDMLYVTDCAFSPDGYYLAIVYEDKRGSEKIEVWRIY